MAESTSAPQRQFSNHLFREIYKNAWLNKVISQSCDKSPVTPGVFWSMHKPERYWIVFCIHDDTEAYLEAYNDAKLSLLHRPVWFTCLNNVHHISPTICSEFNEYEFAITISSGVLRLLAPTREAMSDWVDTMRTKLTEMHILSPCKNMYTALPQLKPMPLLPTRDPTSPLPPPPTVPTVIPPGTERISPNSRNVSNEDEEESSSTNCDNRENDVSTTEFSQRNVLRRNLSAPNPAPVEPYVTVIQVAETTESIRTETRPVPTTNSESSSQISNRPRHPEPSDEDRLVAIDSCQHCIADNATSCTHYGIVYLQDVKPDNENTQSSRDSSNVIPNLANKDVTNLLRTGHSNLILDSSRNESSPSTSEALNISRLEISDSTIPTTSRSARSERNDEVHPHSNHERLNDEIRGRPVVNSTREITRLTLREQQVLRLHKEIMHPCGVRIQLSRKDCNNAIALVDVFGSVWIAGWKQKENPMLYNLLHIGDQIQAVEGVRVTRAVDAHKLLRKSCASSRFVSVIVRRVPHGRVFAIQREVEGQSLGIVQEQNTAVIKEVIPNSLAAKQGLSQRTPTNSNMAFTNWVLTEINGRPLNLFFKNNEVRDRLNAIGLEISILVQPFDLIKQLKKQLKSLKNYKDYIVE